MGAGSDTDLDTSGSSTGQTDVEPGRIMPLYPMSVAGNDDWEKHIQSKSDYVRDLGSLEIQPVEWDEAFHCVASVEPRLHATSFTTVVIALNCTIGKKQFRKKQMLLVKKYLNPLWFRAEDLDSSNQVVIPITITEEYIHASRQSSSLVMLPPRHPPGSGPCARICQSRALGIHGGDSVHALANWAFIIVWALFLIPVVVWAAVAVPDNLDRVDRMTQTTCTISENSFLKQKEGDYATKLKVVYTVSGVNYEANMSIDGRCGPLETCESTYAIGVAIECHYDSQNPSDVRDNVGLDLTSSFILISVFGGMILFATCLWYGVHIFFR